jgi:hypothetical protein
LDDLYGLKVDNQYSVHIACFVFKPNRTLKLQGNHEVADLIWLPFSHLDNPANAYDHYHPADPKIRMPAVLIDAKKDQILWGLSLRMLLNLYELLAWQMRALDAQDVAALKEIENRNRVSINVDRITKKIIAKSA